jgi:hypothetical protein
MTAIAIAGVFLCALTARADTPHLVVSAGPTGQAPSLTVSSDSNASWKCFTVSGSSSGTYNVVWAESNGTTGGIFFGSIAVGTSGAPAPGPAPTPEPTDLPIGTLTTAVSAAVAGVDQATAVKMGDTYEALAKSVDTGVIVSPLQLQLATGTQMLANFNSNELASLKNVTAAVAGWMDAQQCCGKLTSDRMDKYSRSYHATAAAIRPNATAPAASKTGNSTPAAKADPPTVPKDTTGQLPGQSPCANGKCPVPSQYQYRGRWR